MHAFGRAFIGASAAFCLSACIAQGDRAEFAWQALNWIDTAQTATAMTGDTNCTETNPLLGSHPEPATVIEFGLAASIGHVMLTRWLEGHDASRGTMIVWHAAGIAAKSFAVIRNAQQHCQ